MLRHPIGRLRLLGMLEGASFVLLMGVAMPLKYMAGMPLATSIAGSVHGFLFVALVYLAIQTKVALDWPLSRMVMVIVASVLPFGPFVIDARLKRLQEQEPALAV